MRSQLIRLVCVLALVLTGCATGGAPEPTPRTTEGDSAWAFFLDTGDDGDDIWTPGCHFKCTDPDCSGGTEFWGGDFCSGNDLQEWTNSGPHAAESDIARHDCDAACKEKGSSGGRCEPVKNACAGTYQSSRCVCD